MLLKTRQKLVITVSLAELDYITNVKARATGMIAEFLTILPYPVMSEMMMMMGESCGLNT